MVRENEESLGTPGKVYHSTVHDIQSEDTIEITMPMEKTKLILLRWTVSLRWYFTGRAACSNVWRGLLTGTRAIIRTFFCWR